MTRRVQEGVELLTEVEVSLLGGKVETELTETGGVTLLIKLQDVNGARVCC